MTLDLTDEETATLLGELDRIIDGDRFPLSASHSDTERDKRQDPARDEMPDGICGADLDRPRRG
jgi:hypothetical protein